jgi:hypothetical protein
MERGEGGDPWECVGYLQVRVGTTSSISFLRMPITHHACKFLAEEGTPDRFYRYEALQVCEHASRMQVFGRGDAGRVLSGILFQTIGF